MPDMTIDQLIHKHLFVASRTITKDEFGTVAGDTKDDLALTLSQFIAKKQVHTAVDGEAVQLSLRLVVLTPDEFRSIVEGFSEAKPNQGELYAGNDAS